jgi:hypothetical protein
MAEDTFDWRMLEKILPRILRAAFWGFLMGGEALLLYYLPAFEWLENFIPAEGTPFMGLMAVFVLFEVAMQLLSGSVLRYALGTARALTTMFILFYTTDGGVISQFIKFGPSTLEVTIEFKAVLAIIIALSLLVVFKNVMHAVEFLSENSEEPIIPPEIP